MIQEKRKIENLNLFYIFLNLYVKIAFESKVKGREMFSHKSK